MVQRVVKLHFQLRCGRGAQRTGLHQPARASSSVLFFLLVHCAVCSRLDGLEVAVRQHHELEVLPARRPRRGARVSAGGGEMHH